MPRVPAGERRPAGQLGGSAAEAPLRPPRPPARPLCARQRRHLGAGSAGRRATGRREGHGSAARVRIALRAWGVQLRGAARATGVRRARCAATGRREGQRRCGCAECRRRGAQGARRKGTEHREGHGRAARCRQRASDSAVPPYEFVPRIPAQSGSPSAPPPGPSCSPSPLNPRTQIHTEHPTSLQTSPRDASHPRPLGAPKSWKNLYLCKQCKRGGGVGGRAASSSSSGHFFFFLATLSFSSISR